MQSKQSYANSKAYIKKEVLKGCLPMENDVQLPDSIRFLESVDAKKAISVIAGVSIIALLFLIWLIYLKDPAPSEVPWVKNLSALNAAFNSLSTLFLLLGFREIKNRNFARHMKFMISAFITSALFLVSYVIYHHFVGDTPFQGQGFIRPVYFFILITHIVLSAFVVPLVLSSFFFAFSGKFKTHRKVSKWTFPIWLYVSVTGVLVFAMLKTFG
jgi:putative membrane protein